MFEETLIGARKARLVMVALGQWLSAPQCHEPCMPALGAPCSLWGPVRGCPGVLRQHRTCRRGHWVCQGPRRALGPRRKEHTAGAAGPRAP